jgi:hypothetical protein
MRISVRLPLFLVPVVVVFMLVFGVGSVFAQSSWWHLQSGSRPSFLVPGGKGQVVATVTNLGDVSTSGVVTVTDVLPVGLSAKTIEAEVLEGTGGVGKRPVVCSQRPAVERPLVCSVSGLAPYEALEMRIDVVVGAGAVVCVQNSVSCERNGVSVSGGGAPGLSVSRPVTVSEEPEGFGVESYEVTPEEEGGGPVTRAGRHPFQVTGTLTMNETATSLAFGHLEGHPVAEAKDLAGLLPAGLIGNPTPFAKCSVPQLDGFDGEECPPQSVIGVASVTVDEPNTYGGLTTFTAPIANMEPARGEAARFGFFAGILPVYLSAHVRSGGDYGVTLGSSDIPQGVSFLSYKLTFWGVPGEAAHDSARSQVCLGEGIGNPVDPPGTCKPLGEASPPPFLAMPTYCPVNPFTLQPEPLYTSAEADSWSEPRPEGQRLVVGETEAMPAMTGCNKLQFEPSIRVTPDGTEGSTATGLKVDVHVPQESILDGQSVAQSAVRGITVRLPAGVALNPSGAGGLEACSGDPAGLPAGALGAPGDQIGYQGEREFESSPGLKLEAFTARLPGSFGTPPGETLEPGSNFCPDAAKIGTVVIHSPLLPPDQPVSGAVYLASQEANPFGSVIAMYIVAEDPVSGTLVKLPGRVSLCQAAGEEVYGKTCEALGQIVARFENNPQLAFEDAELHFFGGERAPLASPARCGAYTTTASFTPWAAEPWDEAAETATASSTFDVTSGPNHSACPGAQLPFDPSATGGATNIQAGAFSPFTATFSRSDGEQNMQSIVAKLPPGLSGILTGVELCPEPQANEGECGENSKIGEATVSVGVGGDPYSVRGGRFYLTGPYNGTGGCTVGQPGCAPFGVAFEVPAKAGPFDLANTKNNHPACDCVLVRAKIEIDPLTAAITITSDPPGSPDAIPTSIEGIPLEVQHINATTTRTGFQFNPTNCEKMQVIGSVDSNENTVDTITVPFQVTNCAALKFQPKFAVSTSGKTSRIDGASLNVKLTYPNTPFGTQANIKQVKVELPKALPSQLKTLQKACTSAQFHSNPAGCPPASIVGHAKATTPLIPVPLEGPAYFVSNGSEAFPNLIVVLQGYGVTIELIGDTFIKNEVTSSTFKTVPDAPVGSFELNLPEGPYSALTTDGNLCKQKLVMPTEFIAQNGATIHQNTQITVTECPKKKKTHHPHKKHHHHKKKKKK